MTTIESIAHEGSVLAFVITADVSSDTTRFFSSDEDAFQAGFVVYPAGGRVDAHVHLPVERRIIGTSEYLLVRSGRCVVDLYTTDRELVASRELGPGDAILSLSGGHGFRMVEDTVLFEIKQGPFGGEVEKERFATQPDGHAL